MFRKKVFAYENSEGDKGLLLPLLTKKRNGSIGKNIQNGKSLVLIQMITRITGHIFSRSKM